MKSITVAVFLALAACAAEGFMFLQRQAAQSEIHTKTHPSSSMTCSTNREDALLKKQASSWLPSMTLVEF